LIALIHLFPVGSYFTGQWKIYYYSYASDLMIPFGAYFLLCIAEFNWPVFRKWYTKAFFIMGITTVAEMLQLRGIYALGSTFDPLDFVMYFIGVGLAVLFDRLVFKKFITHWDSELN